MNAKSFEKKQAEWERERARRLPDGLGDEAIVRRIIARANGATPTDVQVERGIAELNALRESLGMVVGFRMGVFEAGEPR